MDLKTDKKDINTGDIMSGFNPQPKPEKTPKKAKKPLKRTGIKKKTTSETTLWNWFSKYIRLRDADDNGYCRCIISGKPIFWKDCDAGHFISRRHKATKYDERNVHAQGRGSNRFKSGEQYAYGLAIDKKYGAGSAERILIASRQSKKFGQTEISVMTSYYKNRAERLAKEKGLTI